MRAWSWKIFECQKESKGEVGVFCLRVSPMFTFGIDLT